MLQCFSKNKFCFFSLGNDCLVQIRTDDNTNLSNPDPKSRKFSIIKSSDKNKITNIKYIPYYKDLYLFFTTKDTTYYKKYQEVEIHSIGVGNDHSGAEEKNFGLGEDDGHFIIVTSETYYFEEYYLTDKGRSWFLEKQKICSIF